MSIHSFRQHLHVYSVLTKSFQYSVDELFIPDSDAFEDEINLNVRLIFPMLQSLARSMNDIRFLPGETRLKAVTKELDYLFHDSNHYYNADGILSCKSHGVEVALLEVTGKLSTEDKPKETKDYIKAGYGVISMLHTIGRSYRYSDFEIFKKLAVFFVQVTRKWLYQTIQKEDINHASFSHSF